MPDEIITKAVYPVIRACIAKRLVETHHLNQKEVANILGVTQAAISYYLSDKRGITKKLLSYEEIEAIYKIADDFASNNISKEELIINIVKLIDRIIKTRELCNIHKFFEKDLNIDECNICDIRYSSGSDLLLIRFRKKTNE